MSLEPALKFSQKMVAARKRNNHNYIRDENKEAANIASIQICGVKMLMNRMKKLVKQKAK